MKTGTFIAVVAVVIVIIGASGVYLAINSGNLGTKSVGLGGGQSSGGTLLSGSSTSTSSGATAATLSETSTVSTTSPSQQNSTIVEGSFATNSSSPVKVLSVEAIISTSQNGSESIGFRVTFQNSGTAPIYLAGGCGSCLSSTVPTDSQIIMKVTGGPRCYCATMLVGVDPGQNYTATSPGCWSGFRYQLMQPGTVLVHFDIAWSSSADSSQSGDTAIAANFTFP